MKQGYNIIGILLGANKRDGSNYYSLGISIQSKDEFNSTVTETKRFSMNATQYDRLANQINQLKGKVVCINYSEREVSGNNGTFISRDINANSDIEALTQEQTKAA